MLCGKVEHGVLSPHLLLVPQGVAEGHGSAIDATGSSSKNWSRKRSTSQQKAGTRLKRRVTLWQYSRKMALVRQGSHTAQAGGTGSSIREHGETGLVSLQVAARDGHVYRAAP